MGQPKLPFIWMQVHWSYLRIHILFMKKTFWYVNKNLSSENKNKNKIFKNKLVSKKKKPKSPFLRKNDVLISNFEIPSVIGRDQSWFNVSLKFWSFFSWKISIGPTFYFFPFLNFIGVFIQNSWKIPPKIFWATFWTFLVTRIKLNTTKRESRIFL